MPVHRDGGVRYALSGDARLAFRVRGRGPCEIVNVAMWMSNQDFQAPAGTGMFWERLESFATVVSW